MDCFPLLVVRLFVCQRVLDYHHPNQLYHSQQEHWSQSFRQCQNIPPELADLSFHLIRITFPYLVGGHSRDSKDGGEAQAETHETHSDRCHRYDQGLGVNIEIYY